MLLPFCRVSRPWLLPKRQPQGLLHAVQHKQRQEHAQHQNGPCVQGQALLQG